MKIVRKVDRMTGVTALFWLDENDEIRHDWDVPNDPTEQPLIGGFKTDEWLIESCGTTLAALRAELEGEG